MKHTCDVTDYGAVGVAVLRHTERLEVLDHVDIHFPPGIEMPVYDRMDARTPLDSVGIQGAIDAAHDAGGGTVWVPPGDYLIHSLELKSNVTIHLDNGACLYGSPRLDDYLLDGPMPVYTLFDESDGNGLPERRRPVRKLVWANGAENVRVTGSGCVDGQGHAFIIPWLNGNREGDHNLRPREMFALVGCRDLCLDGFSIRNASWFSVVIQGCRDVRVRDLAIRSFVGPQQDGIDLIDSSRVTISGCHIHTADDAICLPSASSQCNTGYWMAGGGSSCWWL